MLKGTQKKLIMMQTVGSPLFETAYFILKDQNHAKPGKDEMLKEANRIIMENAPPKEKAIIARRRLLLSAFLGFLSGELFLGLIWLASLA